MTTCSDGDSFYLDASISYDDLGTMDGCYSYSGLLIHDITLYGRDGDLTHDEPVMYVADSYGTSVSSDMEVSVCLSCIPGICGIIRHFVFQRR